MIQSLTIPVGKLEKLENVDRGGVVLDSYAGKSDRELIVEIYTKVNGMEAKLNNGINKRLRKVELWQYSEAAIITFVVMVLGLIAKFR